MDHSRQAATMSGKFDESFGRRVVEAKEWNARLAKGEVHPGLMKKFLWRSKSILGKASYAEQEERWRTVDGVRTPSIAMALNDVLGVAFWLGGSSAFPQP